MRAHHNYIAVTILKLSRREFYRMNPGLFYDMVQIHSNNMPHSKSNAVD